MVYYGSTSWNFHEVLGQISSTIHLWMCLSWLEINLKTYLYEWLGKLFTYYFVVIVVSNSNVSTRNLIGEFLKYSIPSIYYGLIWVDLHLKIYSKVFQIILNWRTNTFEFTSAKYTWNISRCDCYISISISTNILNISFSHLLQSICLSSKLSYWVVIQIYSGRVYFLNLLLLCSPML